MIRVQVNARPTELEDGAAVLDLVARLTGRPDPPGVAVARNGGIVPRARWPEVRLAEGDRLEVVSAVWGG